MSSLNFKAFHSSVMVKKDFKFYVLLNVTGFISAMLQDS